MTTCIQETNPAGGFASSHGVLCAYKCGDKASEHVHVGYWCGNLCPSCARKDQAKYKGAVVLHELRGVSNE